MLDILKLLFVRFVNISSFSWSIIAKIEYLTTHTRRSYIQRPERLID